MKSEQNMIENHKLTWFLNSINVATVILLKVIKS